MPRTNIEQARLCAERIRRMTEELAFPEFDRSFGITSSFGIAQYRLGEDLKEMLAEQTLHCTRPSTPAAIASKARS